jgi:hypothetical protein
MAKWSEKMMAEGGSAAAQPMGTVDACDCGVVEFWQKHHQNCPTQLHRQQDKVAYDMETERMKKAIINIIDGNTCPTCKDGVCQCGPDEEEWLDDVDEGTEEWVKVTVQPAYYDLFIVLQKALYQAQDGKGAERHGNGLSFTEQPALTITRAVGLGFPLGQAMKKIQECQRMDPDAAKRELLGAINYLAAAVLFLDE